MCPHATVDHLYQKHLTVSSDITFVSVIQLEVTDIHMKRGLKETLVANGKQRRQLIMKEQENHLSKYKRHKLLIGI